MSAGNSVGPGSKHLAAGPALGYVYQFQVALLQLVPHALRNNEASVQVEVLDDVSLEFPGGVSPKVIQVHQEAGSRPLTDRNPKVWKTLGIWSREQRDLVDDQRREMTLFSTQVAEGGSGVSHLTCNDHEPLLAEKLLTAIAADPNGAKTTADDRAAFHALGEGGRIELLERVLVVDGAAPPVDMQQALVEALMPTHDAGFVDSMAKVIEGWWWRKLPVALKEGAAIHSLELRSQIDEARRMHSHGALPILQSLSQFDPSELPNEQNDGSYAFLGCLEEISASERRRHRAVNQYRMAFAHRSRWAREGLLGPQEIDRYDDDLVGQWAVGSDQMLRHIDPETDSEAKATAGHNLWDEMERGMFRPIRPGTPDDFIQCGSFHQLANLERVAWHPDSASRIHSHLDEETEKGQ